MHFECLFFSVVHVPFTNYTKDYWFMTLYCSQPQGGDSYASEERSCHPSVLTLVLSVDWSSDSIVLHTELKRVCVTCVFRPRMLPYSVLKWWYLKFPHWFVCDFSVFSDLQFGVTVAGPICHSALLAGDQEPRGKWRSTILPITSQCPPQMTLKLLLSEIVV